MTRRIVRAPMSAFALLQQEVSDLFRKLALDRGEASPAVEWSPPVDVYESRERLVVVVEVPGMTEDQLRVAFREGALLVTGERRARRTAGAVSFLCLERPSGRFERSIPLPVPVETARARATLAGGLLTITVPRLLDRRGQTHTVPIEREPAE